MSYFYSLAMADKLDPSKHHYIPEFYLRWWTGADGRVERYSRPIPSKIAVRRVFPSQIGWKRDLYASPGHGSGKQWLEKDLLQRIDNHASLGLWKLNGENPALNAEERTWWTIFLRSLLYRTPEGLPAIIGRGETVLEEVLEQVGSNYERRRGRNDPLTFEEFKSTRNPLADRNSILDTLPEILTNPRVGQIFNNLHTRIITLPDEARDFLLSDEPLARTNGIMKDDGHIAIPISPRKLFLSTWRIEQLQEFSAMQPKELVRAVNIWITESARHFVIARDKSQGRFIRNHFGRNPIDLT
jgi:Protein of unknown function (DUF4238)